MRITRRQFYTTLAAASTYPWVIEPRWLELTRRTVRVLHVSDLHSSFFVTFSMIEHAVDVGIAAKPDFICVTGDFITRALDSSRRITFGC